MKLKLLLIASVVLAGACASNGDRSSTSPDSKSGSSASPAPEVAAKQAPAAEDHDGHGHGSVNDVPAFETDPAALKSLAPTLSPAMFTGKQRQGYAAAKTIPKTLAQLPCYCHCDKGFGHKSLHTCFVDDHAAHCATCIDEALLAYQLETEQKLTPEQIRERVIAQYSTQ
jgi:hypothetical protein